MFLLLLGLFFWFACGLPDPKFKGYAILEEPKVKNCRMQDGVELIVTITYVRQPHVSGFFVYVAEEKEIIKSVHKKHVNSDVYESSKNIVKGGLFPSTTIRSIPIEEDGETEETFTMRYSYDDVSDWSKIAVFYVGVTTYRVSNMDESGLSNLCFVN